jgi:carbamoyl-phosphate synthase small subunit
LTFTPIDDNFLTNLHIGRPFKGPPIVPYFNRRIFSMKALLMLEDGWHCECSSFTGQGEVFGELVFNTGLTGYQEIITDPSYQGQIVMMTNTMVGNYGIRSGEGESLRIHTRGFVVKEYAGEPLGGRGNGVPGTEDPSGDKGRAKAEPGTLDTEMLETHAGGNVTKHPVFLKTKDHRDPVSLHGRVVTNLASYLAAQGVLGAEGVDTRFLTKHIRERGEMKAGITTRTLDGEKFLAKVRASPGLVGRDLVKEVTCPEPYLYADGGEARIAVLDCGIKVSSLYELASRGCRVEVFPAYATKKDIVRTKPDGVLLSNGPGDPAALPGIVGLVQSLIGELPIFGICLGHQMIGQALGGRTFKLKFGHHGGNHPVRDERTKKVFITTQNHGFAVDPDTLQEKDVEVSFVNLNDRTNEGLRHKTLPLFSVQFHPEAAPGPHDTLTLFDEFLEMIGQSVKHA